MVKQYLSIKDDSLFVFHVEISQTMVSFVVHLVLLEILGWLGVQQGDFIMFRLTLQKLLNSERFCHWIFNKIKKGN